MRNIYLPHPIVKHFFRYFNLFSAVFTKKIFFINVSLRHKELFSHGGEEAGHCDGEVAEQAGSHGDDEQAVSYDDGDDDRQ